jgi:hypothetical protein
MARFRDIILKLKEDLDIVYEDGNAVIVSARREVPRLVGDKDLLVRVRSATDFGNVTAAAGRHAMWIKRYVDFIIRSRLYTDVSRQDLQWLTEETKGILAIEELLLDNFQLWHPVTGALIDDAQTNADDQPQTLLVEPARFVNIEDPNRESISTDPNVGMLTLRLELIYEQTLNQLYDAAVT